MAVGILYIILFKKRRLWKQWLPDFSERVYWLNYILITVIFTGSEVFAQVITNLSVNLSQDSESYWCELLEPFVWKQNYLTVTGVYLSLVFLASVNLLMIPFTIFFNSLLVYLIFFQRQAREKQRNIVVGYLAMTDLAVGLGLQPLFVATELCRITGQCNICILDNLVWYFGTVVCRSSLNHLVLIAWERYVAIKHALRYATIVTTNKLLSGSIAAWLIPIILEGLLFIEVSPFASIIVLSVNAFLSLSIIVYFYTSIYKESLRHQQSIKETAPSYGNEANRTLKQEFKAAKTTFFILTCVLVCYMPYAFTMIGISSISFPVNMFSNSLVISISSWTATLVFLNSLIDPMIYGWRVEEIKRMVKNKLLQRADRRVGVTEMHG